MEKYSKQYTSQKAYQAGIHSAKVSINTMLIVKVLKIDTVKQTVDVQPVIKSIIQDKDGTKKVINVLGEQVFVSDVNLPAIMNVPIHYMRSGLNAKFAITMPIAVDDEGMLIISQQDLTQWKKLGSPANQIEFEMFNLNDGVFIPGVPNETTKLAGYSASNLELRAGDDKISLDGKGNINITGKLIVSGDITANGKSLDNHTHSAGSYMAPEHAGSVTGTSGSPI